MTTLLETTSGKPVLPPSCKPLHVALVDEELPYPPTSGKRIRTLNLTLRLAQRHRLTYLCHRNADPAEAEEGQRYFAQQGIQTVVVERTIPPKFGPSFYVRLAANLLSPLPYSVVSHDSAALRQALRDHAATHSVDLWHCEWTPYAQHCGPLPASVSSSHTTSNPLSGNATTRRKRTHCDAGILAGNGASSVASRNVPWANRNV